VARSESRCHFAWLDAIPPDRGLEPASLAVKTPLWPLANLRSRRPRRFPGMWLSPNDKPCSISLKASEVCRPSKRLLESCLLSRMSGRSPVVTFRNHVHPSQTGRATTSAWLAWRPMWTAEMGTPTYFRPGNRRRLVLLKPIVATKPPLPRWQECRIVCHDGTSSSIAPSSGVAYSSLPAILILSSRICPR
jgi:hypothetical protein